MDHSKVDDNKAAKEIQQKQVVLVNQNRQPKVVNIEEDDPTPMVEVEVEVSK